MKLAEATKRQRDAAFRQQRLDPMKNVVFSEDTSGGGSSFNPPFDLITHKTSSDHDSRYYTQTEVEALLAALGSGGSGAFDFGLITSVVDITQDWGSLT